MESKIQLSHPAGKKAVSMEKQKFNLLKKTLLKQLKIKGDLTHKELLQSVKEEFDKNKTEFTGSIEWHMEWVKLDLEARKQIKRIGDKASLKFTLA